MKLVISRKAAGSSVSAPMNTTSPTVPVNRTCSAPSPILKSIDGAVGASTVGPWRDGADTPCVGPSAGAGEKGATFMTLEEGLGVLSAFAGV